MLKQILSGYVSVFYSVVEKRHHFFFIGVASHSNTHGMLKVCSSRFVPLTGVLGYANLSGFIEQFCRFFRSHCIIIFVGFHFGYVILRQPDYWNVSWIML